MAAPTFNTIYLKHSDNVARDAEITIENDTSPSLAGGEDYGPASLVDDDPGTVGKINESDSGSPATGLVSGAYRIQFPSKQPVALIALIHTTLDETEANPGSPAPSVRLEANDSGTFGSPSFSADLTIPPWLGVGSGRWPRNPWRDLRDVDDYDPAGWLFYWLVIDNNSQNIEIGELILSPVVRQFDPDLRWGLRVGGDKPQIENRTAFEVSTIYPRNTTVWEKDAEIILTDDMRDALEEHWYDVNGGAQPFLIIPSGPGTPVARLVRYTTTQQQQVWTSHDFYTQRLGFKEVGRGLRPGV